MASLSQIASTPDLTEQVYQRLLYAICDGELAPARGSRRRIWPQRSASRASPSCRRCVCSRRRVLSAMPGGAACGWRRSRRKRSPVYEVRAVLDGLAARRAAQANAELDPTIILEGRRAAAGQRIGSMIDADMQFHHLIYAASVIRSLPRPLTITGPISAVPWGGAANRRPAPSCVGRA